MYIRSNQSKEDIRQGINRLLESMGFNMHKSSLKKFNRLNKATLNEMYNLLRYQGTNSEHVENDFYMCYGINLIED